MIKDNIELVQALKVFFLAQNYNAVDDPYGNYDEFLKERIPKPVLLIESENSEIETAVSGYSIAQRPTIQINCFVSCSDKTFAEYRAEAEALGRSVIELLEENHDSFEDVTLTPNTKIVGEMMVGSVKCCNCQIIFEARTYMHDNLVD